MNFHQLLHQRDALLRQAHLANVAFAYTRLGDFAARIDRARLHGPVTLSPGDPDGEQPWPGLCALEGSQAALEEHFLEEEVVELTDILSFMGETIPREGYTFHIENLAGRFRPALRRELEAAGIARAVDRNPIKERDHGHS